MAELKTSLVIEAQTHGSDKVAELADELRSLGTEAGDAGPEFARLATDLETLSRTQGLVEQFAALKKSTAEYAESSQVARAWR